MSYSCKLLVCIALRLLLASKNDIANLDSEVRIHYVNWMGVSMLAVYDEFTTASFRLATASLACMGNVLEFI